MASDQMSDGKRLVVINLESAIAANQRIQLQNAIDDALGSDFKTVVVIGGISEIATASPYQLTMKVGKYSVTHGFPTLEEMRRFECDDQTQANESCQT